MNKTNHKRLLSIKHNVMVYPCKRTINATDLIFNTEHSTVNFGNIIKFHVKSNIFKRVRTWTVTKQELKPNPQTLFSYVKKRKKLAF